MDRRTFLAGTGAAAIMASPAVRAATRETSGAAERSRKLLDRMSEALLVEYPDDATFLGLDTGAHAALNARLTGTSPAAYHQRAAACATRLKQLKAFDARALTGIDAINFETTLYAHELAEEGYKFPYGDNTVLHIWQAESNTPYTISQGGGSFATIPDFLDSQHKIDTAIEAEGYLSRLTELARCLDGETERVKHEAGLGVIAPDFLLDLILRQQTAYRAKPVSDWGLVKSIASRTHEKGISEDWATRARAICEREVAPALDRQIAALQDLRTRANHDAGCWKLPDGEAYYRWQLKVGTTTSMTADEVHDLGLEQVKSIGAEMDALLRAQGLTQGSVGARMSALGKDPRFLFPDSDKGRADLLAYLNGIIVAIRAKLPEAFATRQKADLVIKRVPPEIEAGAPDGYEQDGPIDGSRPATYYINLRDMGNWPRFSLPTLCFHEGLPGHVWQGKFAHSLPVIRSQLMFNAYVEGWALYAEQLGDELGMYADDPFGKLGYLQSVQFRACRLVVDTGLHAKRWSREQAIQWMVENNGSPLDSSTGEIDRYCAWPGQACGYQIGHLHIDGLRTKAKAALGSRFDPRTFNDMLLTSGALPLDVLDRVVADFIARP